MMTIKNKYIVPFPVMPDNTQSFEFNCSIPEGRFIFSLRWNSFKGGWSMYVTIPNGEVRPAAVWPNCTSWSKYPDFSIKTESNLTEIGMNDIGKVSILLMVHG